MLPVLWLCGGPAVGKSATAWRLFATLGVEGVRVAYVDVDQLGMLYPASERDPARHRLKADALRHLAGNYATAGARLLVVSGVVDPEAGTKEDASFPGADVTFVRLTVDGHTLRRRITDRGWDDALADRALDDDDRLSRSPFVDATVDTTGLTIEEATAAVRAVMPSVRGAGEAAPEGAAPVRPGPLDVVHVFGPRGAGTSSLAFALARTYWRHDVPTGFVDVAQLGFLARGSDLLDSGLALANVAAMNRVFAAHGARRLVVAGRVSGREDLSALVGTSVGRVQSVRLRADEARLRRHIRQRAGGSEARLAGDDLVGASPAHQQAVLRAALAEQVAYDRDGLGDAVLDVDERSAEELAQVVRSWP